jgi:hypothetical protein
LTSSERTNLAWVVCAAAALLAAACQTGETQNRWAATHEALYLMRPGEKRFRRYDAHDGLHLQGNPVRYCDSWAPDRACPIYGGAADPGITDRFDLVAGVSAQFWHDRTVQRLLYDHVQHPHEHPGTAGPSAPSIRRPSWGSPNPPDQERGRRTSKVVPPAAVEVTVTRPQWAATICSTM